MGLYSIYISYNLSHRNHTNTLKPRSGKGEGLLYICVQTISSILGQRRCFGDTTISQRKDISSLWLVLLLIMPPTKSMILIPSITHTEGLWIRPGGIRELFLILAHNSDFSLISHYK